MCSGIMTWGREVLALIKESPSEASSPHQPQSKSKQSSWCWSRCKNSHTESSSRGIWDSLGDLLEPRQDWCSWGPYETKLLHSCIRDYHPTLEVTQSLHQSSAPLLPISWPILRVPLGARHWTRHREITEGDLWWSPQMYSIFVEMRSRMWLLRAGLPFLLPQFHSLLTSSSEALVNDVLGRHEQNSHSLWLPWFHYWQPTVGEIGGKEEQEV